MHIGYMTAIYWENSETCDYVHVEEQSPRMTSCGCSYTVQCPCFSAPWFWWASFHRWMHITLLKTATDAGLKMSEIPRDEEWRVSLLGNLPEQRDIMGYQGLQEEPEYVQLQEQIDSLRTTQWKSAHDRNISIM